MWAECLSLKYGDQLKEEELKHWMSRVKELIMKKKIRDDKQSYF